MRLRITVQGVAYDVQVEVLDGSAAAPSAAPAAASAAPTPAAPKPAAAPAAPSGQAQDVAAPIAGSIISLPVSVGDTVNVNDTVAILEAMKMESNIASPAAGTVREILVKPGENVTQGQVLMRIG
jgi:biotin carboxyl carrier protein